MSDWKSEIRNQLLDGSPWGEKNDLWPYEGLERQLLAASPEERSALVQACQALITDADPQVRTGIVAILSEIAPDVGSDWLYSQLTHHPQLFVQVAPEGAQLPHPSLDKEILLAMAQVVKATDQTVIAYLREAARIPDWGTWLLPTLAKVDSNWLVANAAELVPHKVVSVLVPLSPKQRRQIIAQLAPWPQETLDNISAQFWRQFEPAEAQALQALMRGQ
ncbi:MAG: hypothetical protein AB7I41_18980 [Candidatus Sericytochromatia bacterium]